MFRRKKQTVLRIKAKLAWQVAEDPSGIWIGVCEPLNLHATGETWAEFQETANEAIMALFADLFEDDELDAFLRKQGWSVAGDAPLDGGPAPRFDVPTNVEFRHMRDLVPAHA